MGKIARREYLFLIPASGQLYKVGPAAIAMQPLWPVVYAQTVLLQVPLKQPQPVGMVDTATQQLAALVPMVRLPAIIIMARTDNVGMVAETGQIALPKQFSPNGLTQNTLNTPPPPGYPSPRGFCWYQIKCYGKAYLG